MRLAFGYLAVLIAALCFPLSGAEKGGKDNGKKIDPQEKLAQMEAEEAGKEEASEADDASGNMQKDTHSGNLILGDIDDQNVARDAAGTFVEGKKTYYVKFASQELLNQFKPYHGKPVLVHAVTRNNGKYMLIRGFVQADSLRRTKLRESL